MCAVLYALHRLRQSHPANLQALHLHPKVAWAGSPRILLQQKIAIWLQHKTWNRRLIVLLIRLASSLSCVPGLMLFSLCFCFALASA